MTKRLCFGLLIALLFSLAVLPAFAQAPGAVLNGGGHGILSDPYGNNFPVQFAIAGTVNADGTARGNVNFVFQGEMADYWGALPGVTDTLHVFGNVTGGSVSADGTVTLTGTVTEHDFDTGNGKVFVVVGEPFVIMAGPSIGENVFIFQFCALPTFTIAITSGRMEIQSAATEHQARSCGH